MQPSTGVRDGMTKFYERFSANDLGGFDRGLSSAPYGMVIGTGPTEWVEGRENWVGAYQEQITAIPGIRVEAGDPRGWEDGDIGWGADRPNFVLPDGTAVPVRLTMVLHREDGEWRPVQAHFSMGVPDEVMMQLIS